MMEEGDKVEQLVKDIMSFIATRNDELFFSDTCDFENDKFITIATEILGWLRLEQKRTVWKQEKKYVKHKPLKLNYNYPWCRQLKQIVELDERFKKSFVIKDSSFDFSENISEDEKVKIRKYVYDNYVPFSMPKTDCQMS